MKITEHGMLGILLADDAELLRHLPINSETRVTQQQTTIRLRMIEIVAFIGKNSLVAEYGETMCKTARNEELTFVLLA